MKVVVMVSPPRRQPWSTLNRDEGGLITTVTYVLLTPGVEFYQTLVYA